MRPTLDRAFQEYNKKYFDGKLKISGIVFKKLKDGSHGATVFLPGADPAILISVKLRNSGRLVRIVLLHEMTHCMDTHDIGHGPKFQKRIKRLFRLGAYDGLL